MGDDISAHKVKLGVKKADAEFFRIFPLVIAFRHQHHELVEHIVVSLAFPGFEPRKPVPRLGEDLDAGICNYRITIDVL